MHEFYPRLCLIIGKIKEEYLDPVNCPPGQGHQSCQTVVVVVREGSAEMQRLGRLLFQLRILAMVSNAKKTLYRKRNDYLYSE